MRIGNVNRGVGIVALVAALAAPLYLSGYWVGTLLTQMLFLGIVAASLIFLSAYAGMVSLAQVAVYGIAGFVVGNATTNGNTKGLNLGWNPWWGVVAAILIAVGIGLLFGALASRSVGIYFLMITLTYSVIANLSFGQVTDVSGFGGISGIPTPRLIGNVAAHQNRLYYVSLGAALAVYALLRYIVRTPFGMTLQGVRDDPIRMSSLGYNVVAHRTLAFGFASFIAAIGGVLFVWWNGHIDPASIDLSATIDVLVIAVVGGLVSDRRRLGRRALLRDHQQLLTADQLHRAAIQHLDRGDLPGRHPGLARRARRPLGAHGRFPLRAPRATFRSNSDRDRPGGGRRVKGGLDTL